MKTPFLHPGPIGALAAIVASACASAGRPSPSTELRPTATDQTAPAPAADYTPADVFFMSGMIAHHAQAVLIAGWAPTHGAGPSVRALCDRTVVGQRDEIMLMQRWLRERNLPVPDGDASHDTMAAMQHTAPMPGMLTPQQLAQLDRATGAEFDRLFLTFMIQHHRGAITMVDDLFSSPGAGEQERVFRLASDIFADQSTEIARMQQMLAALPPDGRKP
ncbi:MAG: DUF305 domain-containing protein [Acidimicrobiales bacterium]